MTSSQQHILVIVRVKITMRRCRAGNLFLFFLSLMINILVLCHCNASDQEEGANTYPEVVLPQGNLRGFNIVTNHKRVIRGFMGIPYAQPPTGNLRFRAPLPASAWTETLNASKNTIMCPQVVSGRVIGQEDCLYLNVYTPQLSSNGTKSLPVMVWIYGGAFSHGRGDLTVASPKYILDKDVLLVVPNYRLGPLGFLSTGDGISPGNYGLKDQVLALEWVQTNIKYFGGDPSQVTLFGISAGAASVNLLALSDLAIGLFHKCIKMSGSALSPRGYVPRAIIVRHSYRLGEQLGCSNNTSTALVNCLRELSAVQIVDTSSLFRKWNKYPDMVWRPTDEPSAAGAFLTDSPVNLYAVGKIRDIPCISGSVRDEGLYIIAQFYKRPVIFDDFLDRIDDILPHMLLYQEHEDISTHTAALKAYYLNDLTADRNVLLANLTQLIGDMYYIYPTYSALQKQFALGSSPQYLYSFEYQRTCKYGKDTGISKGIHHADDETFLFPKKASYFYNCELNVADFKMVDIMVGFWTSFAINGSPTLASDNSVIWESYSMQDNYLRIGNESDPTLEVKDSFLRERMQFWEELTSSSSGWTDLLNPFILAVCISILCTF